MVDGDMESGSDSVADGDMESGTDSVTDRDTQSVAVCYRQTSGVFARQHYR